MSTTTSLTSKKLMVTVKSFFPAFNYLIRMIYATNYDRDEILRPSTRNMLKFIRVDFLKA